LDNYIAEYKSNFDVGSSKYQKKNPEYNHNRHKYENKKKENNKHWWKFTELEKKQATKELKILEEIYKTTRCTEVRDNGYKRIQYCRYADDFIIGVIGSKDDAKKIKLDIKDFFGEKLKLTLSEEKTKITHTTKMARFLGYDIAISHSNQLQYNNNGVKQRQHRGTVKMYVPKEKWVDKLREYKAFKIINGEKEIWKPIHRGELFNLEDIDIITQYNAEIRELYNYYRLADNVSVLNYFSYFMEYSMYKTYASKYQVSMSKIITQHKIDGVFGINYQTKAGKKRCEFYNQGFKKDDKCLYRADILPQYVKYKRPNSIIARLKGGICELCGKKTDDVRMHQIKRLKDLNGKNDWEQIMLKKRRKTLAVCYKCHTKIHEQ